MPEHEEQELQRQQEGQLAESEPLREDQVSEADRLDDRVREGEGLADDDDAA